LILIWLIALFDPDSEEEQSLFEMSKKVQLEATNEVKFEYVAGFDEAK
jgi:hypothetical protein